MKNALVFFFSALMAPCLFSQQPQAAPTPPAPPLLNRAPVPSQWTITYKNEGTAPPTPASGGGSKAKPTPSPVTTVVTKDQNIILEQSGDSQTWRVQGYEIGNMYGGRWIISTAPGGTFETPDYTTTDFAGFDWVSPQTFVGAQDVMGSHCLVFKTNMVTMDAGELRLRGALSEQSLRSANLRAALAKSAGANAPQQPAGDGNSDPTTAFKADQFKVEVMAYIDDKTRLPIALVYATPNGTTTRVYQYQTPSVTLTLPPDAQKLLDSQILRQKRMSVARAPI